MSAADSNPRAFAPAKALNSQKGNARSSGYEKQPNEWYVEGRKAIDELLNVESFRGPIHDPACGGGNIPIACIAKGYKASGSDLVNRGYGAAPVDFLKSTTKRFNIVTNPPFSLAVDFALHALTHTAGKVVIFQRTTWLEGERRYQRLFRHNHLARIWQFRSRISMPPGGQDIEPKGGSVAYAWFVFDPGHKEKPTLGWLP